MAGGNWVMENITEIAKTNVPKVYRNKIIAALKKHNKMDAWACSRLNERRSVIKSSAPWIKWMKRPVYILVTIFDIIPDVGKVQSQTVISLNSRWIKQDIDSSIERICRDYIKACQTGVVG